MAKFSVGDRCRVYDGSNRLIGHKGTVDSICGHNDLCHVKMDEPNEFCDTPLIHFAQMRKLKPRKPKEVKPIDWAKDAFDCLNHGVELMPVKQLSRWIGVRAVIESYPEGSRVISKADLEKAYRNAYHVESSHAVSEYFENMSKALGFESEGK